MTNSDAIFILSHVEAHGLADEARKLAIDALKAEPRWIPCSERLPEECEEVNVTWVNTEPCPYYANIKGKPFTGSGLFCRGRWYWYSATCKDMLEEYGFAEGDEMDDSIKVIAWMPLPEPYKEQKDG